MFHQLGLCRTICGTVLPPVEATHRYLSYFTLLSDALHLSGNPAYSPEWKPFAVDFFPHLCCCLTAYNVFLIGTDAHNCILMYLMQELRRRWLSIMYHVRDVHSWTENGQRYSCHHLPLPQEVRRKKVAVNGLPGTLYCFLLN